MKCSYKAKSLSILTGVVEGPTTPLRSSATAGQLCLPGVLRMLIVGDLSGINGTNVKDVERETPLITSAGPHGILRIRFLESDQLTRCRAASYSSMSIALYSSSILFSALQICVSEYCLNAALTSNFRARKKRLRSILIFARNPQYLSMIYSGLHMFVA